MIIKNAEVYNEHNMFEKKDIYITKDRIAEARTLEHEPTDDQILDAEGLYAIPGLTDIHFHGCIGYDFCDGTQEATEAIANYQAKNGITSIAPATMSLGDDSLTQIFSNAASYSNKSGATLVGINMEGPYLSCAKKGAQNAAYLMPPRVEHFRRMQKLSGGLIKLVAIAPEEEGAMEFIKELKDEVVISVAHTTADYQLALEAFQNGASQVTHLYNGMAVYSHRNPGVIGAAFDTEHCNVELITDGVHVDPSVVRATFKMFGEDRIILISDSMMATGLQEGEYSLGGQAVTVTGNKATLHDGTIAGSTTNLMKCLQTVTTFGIPLESAVKCAAVNPAKAIGIYGEYGSLTPGKYANIVLLDKDLKVKAVILRGQVLSE